MNIPARLTKHKTQQMAQAVESLIYSRSVNLLEVNPGAGKMEFIGSGTTTFTCSEKTCTKSGSDMSFSDISKMQYCSDSDILKVAVMDFAVHGHVPHGMVEQLDDKGDEFASNRGSIQDSKDCEDLSNL